MFVFLPWKFASPLPANFFHSTEIQEVKVTNLWKCLLFRFILIG